MPAIYWARAICSRPSFVFRTASPQGAGDQLDGLEMEHIRHLPGRLGDIALDGVGQGIHAGGGSEAFWHGRHHLGIDDRDDRDIVGVHTDEFTLLLHVGDDIVDGHLGSRAGRGGDRNDRHAGVLSGSHALQTAHIGQIRGCAR